MVQGAVDSRYPSGMLHLLHRLLGMNHRERRRSLPLFGYLFLTMAGSVASKAARTWSWIAGSLR